jgi:hypothetical protein
MEEEILSFRFEEILVWFRVFFLHLVNTNKKTEGTRAQNFEEDDTMEAALCNESRYAYSRIVFSINNKWIF